MAKITEETITTALSNYFSNAVKYKIRNIFLFNWESDYFILRPNGYCVEFEVKITKSDFNNDINKVDKHSVLKYGFYTVKRKVKGIVTETQKIETFKPNKFFYVVPKGMITEKDIPKYSGLMYYDNHCLWTVKEAPFIHKNKLEKEIEQKLCNKFYHRWKEKEFRVNEMEREQFRLPNWCKSELIRLLGKLKEKEPEEKRFINVILNEVGNDNYL